MNGNVCRKHAARIIWFNKLLEAHGKLGGIVGAELSLHAPKSEGSTMDVIPEEAGVEKSHIQMLGCKIFLRCEVCVVTLSP